MISEPTCVHPPDPSGGVRANAALWIFRYQCIRADARALACAHRQRNLRGARHRSGLSGLEFAAPVFATILPTIFPAVMTRAGGQQHNKTYECHSFHDCFLSS